MSKPYRVGGGTRAVNAIFRRLAAGGRGTPYLHVLTVTGRASGLDRSVPVDVMEVDDAKYLVAPYGDVNWVRNLRAARNATLQRGSHVQQYDAVEVSPTDAVPIIREYIRVVPITKNYWNAHADSTDDDVLEDARTHPVFRLTASGAAPDEPHVEIGSTR